jgi:phenylalanyl-tRNA synthetase alpha chain
VVAEGVTFANMKAMLHGFLEAFFERDLQDASASRRIFRSPEPSAEVDMSCVLMQRRGLSRAASTPDGSRFSGCGMVHPKVLEAGASTPRNTPATRSAWASIVSHASAMACNDLRLFFENDLRFLAQFRAG